MVRMDKLLDAWRADPRVEPTVELCAMLTRACMKPGARDVIPMAFVVALATEATIKHPRSVEVLLALATLYHAAGEMRAATTVLDKAKAFAADDQRVIDLSEKVRLARATRELVSDAAPRQLAPATSHAARPSVAPAVKTASERPSPTRSTADSQLDAETFDAPTTPLDPPTEPGALGRSAALQPRRSPTTHGLAPPPPFVPPPVPAAPPKPAAAPPATAASKDDAEEANPRRSRTLLGGAAMLAPPAPLRPAPAGPPPPPRAPDPVDADPSTGVMSGPPTGARTHLVEEEDSGPSTTVDRIFTPPVEPKTTQRDVPQIPSRAPPSRRPPPSEAMDEPLTKQRDVPQIPSRGSMSPPSPRRPAAVLRPGVPAPAPSQSTTTVGDQPRDFGADDQKTSTRVGPAPDAEQNRPAARRLAARKPGGRGVGTDDPLMKAALARRARAPEVAATSTPDLGDAGPQTRAEHDVPTKVGHMLGNHDDERPTRNLVAGVPGINPMGRPPGQRPPIADPESAPTRTRTGPLPMGSSPPPSDRSARGSSAGHLIADNTTSRGPALPSMASPETTQTDVDSVSEDAPTRTLTGAPPAPLPKLGSADVDTSDSFSSPSMPRDMDNASTFSKVVTQRWQPGGLPPREPPANARWSAPSAQSAPPVNPPTDDSVDTHLRPLAPLARPMMRPAAGVPAKPPAYAAPSVANRAGEDDGPGTYVMKPEESAAASRSPYAPPKPAPPPHDDDSPGTYVMRADEKQAASRVDPLAGSYSGLRADIEGTIDPSDIMDDESSAGADMPGPMSFGPPPGGMVTRGVAFGAGALGHAESRPPAPLDFGSSQSGLPALDPLHGGGMGFGDRSPFPEPQRGGFPEPQRGGFPEPQRGGFPEPQQGFPEPQRGGFGTLGDELGGPAPLGGAGPLGASYDSFGSSREAPAYPSPYGGAGSQGFPTDASYPSDDGPLNFDPIPIPAHGEAQSFPSNAPPLGYVPEPVMDPGEGEPEARRRPLGLYIALGVAAVMVAVLVGYASFLVISDYKRTSPAQAQKPTTDVEKALWAGTPADLARADTLLVELEKNPAREVALLRVRTETLRSLEVSGKEEGLAPAIDAAHAAGLGPEVTSGEIALAMAQGDPKKAAQLVARDEGALAKDPFFQLAAGAELEANGDPKALDRYDAAVAAEPTFMPARVRAIRSLLLDGDLTEGEKRLAELPDSASRTALQALAWVAGRAAGATETVSRPKTLPTTAEVPRELLAAYASTSLVDAEKGDPSTLTKRGIEEADSPAVAVLFGRIALNRGDVTSAIAGAKRALQMGPRTTSALRLLGRTALETGKFDVMKDVLATLPEESTRELRSLRAYEVGDLDDLTAIAAKVKETDPERFVVAARLDRLKGLAPLSDDRVGKLVSGDALGGELCAVDALLDRGNLAKAKELIARWPDATAQPLRARRYARLMRYEGNLDEALLALGGATTTVPTASLERFILDAEIPKHRQEALDLLGQRPTPLDLPGPTAKLLEGYIRARNDDTKMAKEILETAAVPSKETALPTRVCAALAFGEIKDKRAESLVRDLYGSFPQNPDVLRAAQALGVASTDSSKP